MGLKRSYWCLVRNCSSVSPALAISARTDAGAGRELTASDRDFSFSPAAEPLIDNRRDRLRENPQPHCRRTGFRRAPAGADAMVQLSRSTCEPRSSRHWSRAWTPLRPPGIRRGSRSRAEGRMRCSGGMDPGSWTTREGCRFIRSSAGHRQVAADPEWKRFQERAESEGKIAEELTDVALPFGGRAIRVLRISQASVPGPGSIR